MRSCVFAVELDGRLAWYKRDRREHFQHTALFVVDDLRFGYLDRLQLFALLDLLTFNVVGAVLRGNGSYLFARQLRALRASSSASALASVVELRLALGGFTSPLERSRSTRSSGISFPLAPLRAVIAHAVLDFTSY